MHLSSVTSLVALQLFSAVMADVALRPSQVPVLNQRLSLGCFTAQINGTKMTNLGTGEDEKPLQNTAGACGAVCQGDKKKYLVFSLHANDCYCGFERPPKDTYTKDKDCNFPCPQFPGEPCGGLESQGGVDAWSLYSTGNGVDIPYAKAEQASATTSTAAPSNTGGSDGDSDNSTGGSKESGSPDGTTDEKKDGPNVAGIAAGVVVGVVVIAGTIAGIYFFMRRRRNAEIEEEHRRNAAVNAFISGAKPPGSSGGISMTDSRLEPGLAHRRLSDGSIADNQDYSRKILRVTNA